MVPLQLALHPVALTVGSRKTIVSWKWHKSAVVLIVSLVFQVLYDHEYV